MQTHFGTQSPVQATNTIYPFGTPVQATNSDTTHPFGTPVQATNSDTTHPFEAADTSTATVTEAPKAPRKKARRLSMEEQQYVIVNYKDKNPVTIAQELTLQATQSGRVNTDGTPLAVVTSAQVGNTVREARKKVEARIAAAQEAGDQNAVAVLSEKLKTSLPKRSFRGAGGSTGPKTSSLDSIVDALFAV